ncbi:MAG: type II toxin-antitoxin system VapC family toxin [Burkholderiales bacterium]
MRHCLVDTGILYAAADRDDAWNDRAAHWLNNFPGRVLVASPIIPEVCYLLNTYLGRDAELKFIRSLKQRELTVEHFTDGDLHRIEELLQVYAELNLGFVDAANVAIAERFKITEIATTDRRHFSAIQPSHCAAFSLLP